MSDSEKPRDTPTPPKHKPTDVIGHAEAAALYFRTLLDEGVPLTAAVSMAAQYGTSLLIVTQEPRREWED